MKTLTFTNLRKLLSERPDIWFFIFATVTFIIVYVWSLFITPKLLEPLWFILFTFLTFIHVILHWMLGLVFENPNYRWPYIIGQGTLAFAIVFLSQNIGMVFCLYFALIGESVGIFKQRLWVGLSIAFFLVLFLVSFSLIGGISQMAWWGLGTIPLIIFVILYVSLYTREASAREEAQKLLSDLEIAHNQLSEYTDQVEKLTLTAERQRMARELHDTLAQGLAGLILQLEAADSHISANRFEKSQEIIQQAMIRARVTLADARQAIGDLREIPSSPAELSDGIRSEVEKFTRTTGIPCDIDLCKLNELTPDAADTVIRTVSEGLMNIAKHAQATKTLITIYCLNDRLRLEIGDNGVGFNSKEAIGQSGHYGLLGIRERTRILGGTLNIESEPGSGTVIIIELPLIDNNMNESKQTDE